MNKKEFPEEPMGNDHIWPTIEGGPNEPWNRRPLSRSVNRGQKGPKMPKPDDIHDSSNPPRLIQKIEEHSLSSPYKNYRNKDKGFGGLRRYKLW